jgi:Spy/CpxP family protein refolding chaperone
MKRKTLLAVALSSVLAVGAFAHGMNNQQNMHNQGMKHGGMMNGNMMNGKNMHRGQGMHKGQCTGISGGKMMGGMPMFSQLNLTSEQQQKLSILRDEMRLEMKKQRYSGKPMGKMGAFFQGENFDKDSFKSNMNGQHEKMLTLRANHMEKVFNILTKEQRVQLKKNLEQ